MEGILHFLFSTGKQHNSCAGLSSENNSKVWSLFCYSKTVKPEYVNKGGFSIPLAWDGCFLISDVVWSYDQWWMSVLAMINQTDLPACSAVWRGQLEWIFLFVSWFVQVSIHSGKPLLTWDWQTPSLGVHLWLLPSLTPGHIPCQVPASQINPLAFFLILFFYSAGMGTFYKENQISMAYSNKALHFKAFLVVYFKETKALTKKHFSRWLAN